MRADVDVWVVGVGAAVSVVSAGADDFVVDLDAGAALDVDACPFVPLVVGADDRVVGEGTAERAFG